MFHIPISKRAFIISLLIMISLTLMIYGFIQLNSLSIYDENRWESIRVMETFDLNNFGAIELKSGEFIEIPFTYTGNDSSYSNFMERILTEREAFSKMAPQLFYDRWLIIHIETDDSKVNVFLLNFDQWYQWYRYERNKTHEPRDYILSFRNVSKLDKLVVVNDTFYGKSEPDHLEYCRFSCYFIVLVENPSSEQIKLKYFVTDQVAVLTPYTYMLEKSPQAYKYILFGSILMWLSLGLITPELGFFIISLLSKFMPQEIREEIVNLGKEIKKNKNVKILSGSVVALSVAFIYFRVAFIIGLPHGFVAYNILFWPSELINLEGSYLQLLELDLYIREAFFISLLFLIFWFMLIVFLYLLPALFVLVDYYFKSPKKEAKILTQFFVLKNKVFIAILANLLILYLCLATLEINLANAIEISLLKSSPATKILRIDYIYNFLCENYNYLYPCGNYPFPRVSLENLIAALIAINTIYWGVNWVNLNIALTQVPYTYNTIFYRILTEERKKFKIYLTITILTALIVYPISSYLSHISITLENLIYYTLLALISPIITEFYTKEYLRMLDNL